MEELKFPLIIYSFVGIALCLTFITIIELYKKNHPNLFTTKATSDEKLRFSQITKTSLNVILIYLVFEIFALALMCYQTPPIAIIILCSVFIIFAISNIITIFKKK